MTAIKPSLAAAVALAFSSSAWAFGPTGPSTTTSSYLLPVAPNVGVTSILTVGDSVGGYKMVGIPDGLGAYDNNDGTFTVLMNHEIAPGSSSGAILTGGVARAHNPGAAANQGGAFVSKWVINKSTLAVVSGADLITGTSIWNGTGYNAPILGATFNRFCSADLPKTSAFYNALTGKGYNGMLFMNGEESGDEGKAYATDVLTGTTYNLPHLGKFSWENSVANPFAQDKTIVIGTDDTTPGQVYLYVGDKKSAALNPTLSSVELAGLTGGKLYGIKANFGATEVRTPTPTVSSFTAQILDGDGDVSDLTGAQLQANSVANGITQFLRPEDGAWDTKSNDKFYFVTTDRTNEGAQVGRSRLWLMDFADITNPDAGGDLSLLLDGTEGGQMFDNITVDEATGNVILQEDVGNNPLLGNVWSYDPTADSLTKLLQFGPSNLFTTGGAGFITQDEEASGVIDVTSIFASIDSSKRWYLMDAQVHNKIGGELVEGGQLVLVSTPVPVPAAVWLFGSALAGVAGLRRRYKAA